MGGHFEFLNAWIFEYITKDTLDILIEKTNNLNKQISNFMAYLRKSKYRGSKYKKI